MRNRNVKAVIRLLALMSIFLLPGCQQVKEIPDEIPEQLPNPVKDFTEKDNYVIGLNWYRQWNYGIAAKYWKPLAAEGDCDACYALGLLYFEGLGVGRSYSKAIELWTESAAQGQAQAQISLGIIYARLDLPYTSLYCKKGCGAEKDLPEAYKWFGIAKEIGAPREKRIAEDSLKKIVPGMTADEIKEGDLLVNAWKPDPSRCDSRGYFIVAP